MTSVAPRAWRRTTLAATVAALTMVALLGVFNATNPPSVSGDSIRVTTGARTLVECVQGGTFEGCDRRGGVAFDAVGPYPPPQYIVAAVAEQIGGAGDSTVLRTFSVLSLFSVAAVLVVLVVVGARLQAGWVAPLLVLSILTSPLLYYSRATFGEAFATALITGAAAAALLRLPPWVVASAVFAASATKETAWPFVLVLCAVALWATPIARRPRRRGDVVALGVGTVAAILAHALFDFLRFGTLTNANYTRDFFAVPDLVLSAKLALSQWVAPNAGLAFFWPLATIGVLAALAVALYGLRHAPRKPAGWLPAAVIVLLAVVQTGLLARWWAPFGWIAWGPRLSLPLFPALLLVLVVCHADAVGAGLRRLVRRRAALAVSCALLLALAVPQVTILHHDETVAALFAPTASCPNEGEITVNSGPYYTCLIERAWRSDSVLVDALGGWDASSMAVALILAHLALGAALLAATFQGAALSPPSPTATPPADPAPNR